MKSPFLSLFICVASESQLLKSPTIVTFLASIAASFGSLKLTLHERPDFRYCFLIPRFPDSPIGFFGVFLTGNFLVTARFLAPLFHTGLHRFFRLYKKIISKN